MAQQVQGLGSNVMNRPLSQGLTQLKESISGCKYNTTLMLSRLQRFEDRLSSIDYRMSPITFATESYSKAKENISATLEEVSKTYDYFRIATEVKMVINAGYKPATQKQFFDALGRLSQAKKFFEEHREIKSGGTVLMTIDNLLRNAVVQCVQELERLLVPLGKSVEFSAEDGRYVVINPMSSAAAAEIKSLFALFDKHNQMIHYEVYQGVRIAQVLAELQAEENDHANDWAALLEDVPYSKGSHPLRDYLALAYEMLRGELQLWSNTLDTTKPPAQGVYAAICDATVLEIQRLLTPTLLADQDQMSSSFIIRQCNAFLIHLDVLEIFMARHDDMLEICRPDVSRPTAAGVHLEALGHAMVEACVESINLLLQSSSDPGEPLDVESRDDVKRAFKRGEAVAIVNPGELCDLHPITGNVLHCCEEMGQFQSVYPRLIELVTEVGVPSFPYMYAAELTDLVTSLVDNLHDALLQRADRYNVARPPGVRPKGGIGGGEGEGGGGGGRMMTWLWGGGNKAASAESRVLEVNKSNLFDVGAAEAVILLSEARRHLFLVNNLYSLCAYCRDTQSDYIAYQAYYATNPKIVDDDDDVGDYDKEKSPRLRPIVLIRDVERFQSLAESELLEAQEGFCQAVVVALGLSTRDMDELREQMDHKRADKKASDRLLKAKFAVFNSGMDALLAQQGEWRVTSVDLRTELAGLLVSRVVPVWSAFFDAHSSTPFTKKHIKEYLRFPPHDVTNILAHFFG